jgi:ubiquinone biosynthesis protein UbiJ
LGYPTRVSSIKDRLVAEGVKLAANPQVAKLMQDPRFMKVAMTALSMPAKLSSLTEEQKEAIVKALGLATVDEVRDLRRTVAALERELDALRAELGRR